MYDLNDLPRVEFLRKLKILDTEADPLMDAITHLAKSYFRVPIALVSFVDEDRQWFKSSQGLDASETPRKWAFCDHAIRQDEVMVIPDAQQDERFMSNPLVTGEPHIRFYAGAPIRVEGHALGTVCIIDTTPRQFTGDQLIRLVHMADMVYDILSGLAPA